MRKVMLITSLLIGLAACGGSKEQPADTVQLRPPDTVRVDSVKKVDTTASLHQTEELNAIIFRSASYIQSRTDAAHYADSGPVSVHHEVVNEQAEGRERYSRQPGNDTEAVHRLRDLSITHARIQSARSPAYWRTYTRRIELG